MSGGRWIYQPSTDPALGYELWELDCLGDLAVQIGTVREARHARLLVQADRLFGALEQAEQTVFIAVREGWGHAGTLDLMRELIHAVRGAR